MAIYRVKNSTVSAITVVGQYISSLSYYDINITELDTWRTSQEVFTFVANGTLIVNKGQDNIDDILNPIEGWNYLSGEIKPPTDTIGRWKILLDSPTEEPNKMSFVWTVDVNLNSFSSYQEVLFPPSDGKSIYLEQVIAASPEIPYKITLYIFDQNYNIMINPLLDTKNIWQFKVDNNTTVSAGATTLTVSAAIGFDLNNVIVSGNYLFYSDYILSQLSAESTGYINKIINIDVSSKQITLETPTTINIDPDSKVTYAERPLLVLAGDSNTTIAKTFYPFKISKNVLGEDRYIILKVENVDQQLAGNISVTVYGYTEI